MSAIASSTNPSLIDSGRALLNDLLRPGYFERNAFRILELPVDTTRRQIDKRIQAIELAVQNRMGVPQGSGRCLPLVDAPDTSALGEARNRLTDVRRRFVDEVFWFWSEPNSANTVATALAAGQTKEAVAAWISQEDVGPNDPSGLAAIHNIATLYLLAALSMTTSEEQASDREEAPGVFEESLFRWQILLESPAFWSRLEARAEEMNHPRLADVVPALHAALPSVVAALPLLGIASVPVPLAKQLTNVVRESGLPKDAVEHALGQAARSLSQRILSASKAARDAAESSPLHAAQTCTVFLDHVEPWLGIIDQLLPSSDSTRIKAHDEAALAVLSCQVDFCKETDGWDRGITLLERGSKLAASDDTVSKLKSNLETVRKNHDRKDSFRGPGYHDLPKDLFDEMEKARHDVQARNFDPAINRLRTLHKRGGPHAPAVSKALAYTLGCCSIDRINHGTDNIPNPVDYVKSKLKERVRSTSFMLTAIMAQSGSLSSGAECMICGQRINGSYATLQIPDIDIPVIVCSSCSTKLDRMQDERKSQLRNTFQRALDELYEATALDSTNRWVTGQIADTEKIARNIGITIRKPSPPSTQLSTIGAQIESFGIYRAENQRTIPDKSVASGYSNVLGDVTLSERTERIPLRKGLTFGVTVVATGKAKGESVELKQVWHFPSPGIKNPHTGKMSLRDEIARKFTFGVAETLVYTFDEDVEMLPGQWKFELWDGNKKLVEKSFRMEKSGSSSASTAKPSSKSVSKPPDSASPSPSRKPSRSLIVAVVVGLFVVVGCLLAIQQNVERAKEASSQRANSEKVGRGEAIGSSNVRSPTENSENQPAPARITVPSNSAKLLSAAQTEAEVAIAQMKGFSGDLDKPAPARVAVPTHPTAEVRPAKVDAITPPPRVMDDGKGTEAKASEQAEVDIAELEVERKRAELARLKDLSDKLDKPSPVAGPAPPVLQPQAAPSKSITTVSGLRYEVIRSGIGNKPPARSRVRVRSEQLSEDGKIFGSSGKIEDYFLPDLVKGLSEGIQLMPVGSKFRFHIPPKLGDGKALNFEIELIAIR